MHRAVQVGGSAWDMRASHARTADETAMNTLLVEQHGWWGGRVGSGRGIREDDENSLCLTTR